MVVIDKDYYCVSDTVREGDLFVVIAPENNPENVHYYLLLCTKLKITLMKEFNDT